MQDWSQMVFWGWSALKRRNPRRSLLSHFFSHAAWCLAAVSDFVFLPRRMFAALFLWLSSYFDVWFSFFVFIAGSKNVFFSHITRRTSFTIFHSFFMLFSHFDELWNCPAWTFGWILTIRQRDVLFHPKHFFDCRVKRRSWKNGWICSSFSPSHITIEFSVFSLLTCVSRFTCTLFILVVVNRGATAISQTTYSALDGFSFFSFVALLSIT